MYASILYKYRTRDGSVPNEGKVPTDQMPSFNTLAGVPNVSPPQFPHIGLGNCVLGVLFYGNSNVTTGYNFGCPQSGSFPQNSWLCFQYPTPPAPPVPASWQRWAASQALPPPPMPHPCPPCPPPPPPPEVLTSPHGQVYGNIEVIGGRGKGYISQGDTLDFYLFDKNVVRMYPQVDDVLTVANLKKQELRRVHRRATWGELIEAVECKNRVLKYHPTYPDNLVGVQELIPLAGERGRFRLGSKIMLSDPQVYEEIGDIWHAGSTQPRWLVRWPC